MQTLNKINAMVETILANDVSSRNDDRILFVKVMQTFFQCGETISEEQFKRLPNFDTISRSRRKYQSEGKYLPTDEKVINKRFKRKKAYAEYYKEPIKTKCDCGGYLQEKEFCGYFFKQCLSCDKKLALNNGKASK